MGNSITIEADKFPDPVQLYNGEEFAVLKFLGLERTLPMMQVASKDPQNPESKDVRIAFLRSKGDTQFIYTASLALALQIHLSYPDPIDLLATAPTKGIAPAEDIAIHLSIMRGKIINYVVFETEEKGYMKILGYESKKYSPITAKGGERYLFSDKLMLEGLKGKNTFIVDDVLSTGATKRVMEEFIIEYGGRVAGYAAWLQEGPDYTGKDITVLGRLPIFVS